MGRITYETYDPEDLELPNDTDFEYEGIDESYGTYQEYEAYLPDRVGELQAVDARSLEACAAAAAAVARARDAVSASGVADELAQLLLFDEAVSTARAEDYTVSCRSALDYRAVSLAGYAVSWREAEEVALDAVAALRDFVPAEPQAVTLDEICAANAMFARSNKRAEDCGELREGPVFIGKSLFDADYVAPPADTLEGYMDDLVSFLNDGTSGFDPIAKAAIAHAQFITVHPFMDGNGRTGRALGQRVLRNEGVTQGFLLPTTAVAAQALTDYVDAIERMRSYRGPANPNPCIRHYAACCERAAERVTELAQNLEGVLASWRRRVGEADEGMGAAAEAAMHLFAATPVMTEAMLAQELGNDASSVLSSLLAAGILLKYRSAFCGADVFVATEVMNLLERP